MAQISSTDSNISIDSLEQHFNKKAMVQSNGCNDNVDTILVPFYEKDVLIAVPKHTKRKQKENNEQNSYLKTNKIKNNGDEQMSNYLVNKSKQNSKRTSYLEIFRKQLAPYCGKKSDYNEIRSLSPEVGDSVRDNFSEDISNQSKDFFNTECYNEIYYEQLLSKNFEQCTDYTVDEDLHLPQYISKKVETDGLEESENKFQSISEVSQHRRRGRRITVQPIQNIHLGGLGPDMEKIKPNLERSRSLQRYSERVRMENRLKIYKKTIEDEMKKKTEKEQISRSRVARIRSEDSKIVTRIEDKSKTSYLLNKVPLEVVSSELSKVYSSKSKSANVQKSRERNTSRDTRVKSSLEQKEDKNNERKNKAKSIFGINKENKKIVRDEGNTGPKYNENSKAVNTEIQHIKTKAPVHISFLVNINGLRPSSALRTLEEKHRMYQEKVKAFTVNVDNI